MYFAHPENLIRANPLVTPRHIVPEWYFLTFYAILRAIPNKTLGIVAMFGSIVILFLLPYFDKPKAMGSIFKPTYKFAF
jgi:quinol-cytochrome oxidoreductase complex cytochrome b subunit